MKEFRRNFAEMQFHSELVSFWVRIIRQPCRRWKNFEICFDMAYNIHRVKTQHSLFCINFKYGIAQKLRTKAWYVAGGMMKMLRMVGTPAWPVSAAGWLALLHTCIQTMTLAAPPVCLPEAEGRRSPADALYPLRTRPASVELQQLRSTRTWELRRPGSPTPPAAAAQWCDVRSCRRVM